METTVHSALRAASDTLDDLEMLRIATGNRVNALTRSGPDADGIVRGYGLDVRDPMVAVATLTHEGLIREEKALIKSLEAEVKRTPYAEWIATHRGIGAKTVARLLGSLGDPYMNEVTGEPRTLRQLWAYAGLAVDNGVARHPGKGASQAEVFASGKGEVKKRAWLIVEGIVKQGRGEKYREIYDAEKVKYADTVHASECARCTPAGRPPAPVGSPLKPGHIDARARRHVSKEILRDLWLIARAHHETGEVPSPVTPAITCPAPLPLSPEPSAHTPVASQPSLGAGLAA